jgi:hypothetical protein
VFPTILHIEDSPLNIQFLKFMFRDKNPTQHATYLLGLLMGLEGEQRLSQLAGILTANVHGADSGDAIPSHIPNSSSSTSTTSFCQTKNNYILFL